MKERRSFPLTNWYWLSEGDKFYEFDVREECPDTTETDSGMDLNHHLISSKAALSFVKKLLTPSIIGSIMANNVGAIRKKKEVKS
jgi:hypothetical protein